MPSEKTDKEGAAAVISALNDTLRLVACGSASNGPLLPNSGVVSQRIVGEIMRTSKSVRGVKKL